MKSSSEENTALLRELALSLLAPSFDPQARQPQLLPGSLPASLPFNLPFPTEYRIIGSFIRNPDDILIILETGLSPEEVIAFYTEQMQAEGWSEPNILKRHRQSFTNTFYDHSLFITLCKGKRGPALQVGAFNNQSETRRTKVRLNIDTRSRNSPCTQSSEIFMQVGALLPSLKPPQGGHQQVSGGGGSDSESAATSATLNMESDITLPLLAAHYAQQLEQAGWQKTDEGSSGPTAWHSWEFRDKENERWLGVFTMLQVPGMEWRYFMQLNINWVGEKEPN